MWTAAVLAASLLAQAGAVTTAADRRRALSHHRSGEALMAVERYEEAAEEFRQALDLDPLLVISHYDLGLSYMALRRYVDASIAYRGAFAAIEKLSTLDQQERAARERANRDEINDLKETAQQLRTGRIKNPRADDILRVEERLRVLETLRFTGERALAPPAALHLAMGSALLRLDKLAEAEASYQSALAADPSLGAAHNNLAFLYMVTGRYAEARASLRAAEKAGFHVDPRFKDDLETRARASRN